jgi:hypothetical protein
MEGNKRVHFNGVKYVLRKHEETGKEHCRKGWRISPGGYDLWWDMYYNGCPVLSCIAGKLVPIALFPEEGFGEKEQKRLINKVLTEYKDLKYEKE